ncbi:FHA domain-containing protein, partial [Dermabacteraceae bacterium P13101]
LTDHANRQQYMFVGPLSVSLERDDEVPAGNFETESRTERGAAATVTAAAHNQRITPILEIDSQQYLLTGDVTVIGRGENADIILEDTGVSRDHVEFRVVSDGLVVTDLGSTNGTYVNGSRITTPVDISDGAIVKIGRTVITVTLRDGNGSEW